MSALPPKADITDYDRDIRFVPKADIQREFLQSRLRPTLIAWCGTVRQSTFLARSMRQVCVMSALPPKADFRQRSSDVRFVPKADIQAAFGYYCWWARVLKFVEHHP
jgi:hypothetical protein